MGNTYRAKTPADDVELDAIFVDHIGDTNAIVSITRVLSRAELKDQVVQGLNRSRNRR